MPAASDPSAALGVPAVGEHRRSLLSPGFVLVTAATLFYFIALGALLPTLPVYVEDELGGGSVAVGVTVGVFAVSAALLRPLAGRLGDTRGRRILVIGGSLVMGVSVLAYTLVDSIAALVALRLLTGAGEAAMWVGAATAIQDMAPDDRRGEAASYFSVALYAGLAFGPLVGEGLRDSAGFHAVWIFAGCCGLIACALGFGTPRDVRREPQPFRLLHPAALGPGAILLLGMLPFIGFATFIALYGPTVGFSDIPLMEDIDFSYRAKRLGAIAPLREKVTTSFRRWEQNGPLRTIVHMWTLRFLYWLGISPHTLQQFYGAVR